MSTNDVTLEQQVTDDLARLAQKDADLAQRIRDMFPDWATDQGDGSLSLLQTLEALRVRELDQELVLRIAGPYFNGSSPPDDKAVFARLALFGRIVHRCPNAARREYACQLWADHLKQWYGTFIPWPRKIVDAAVAGRPIGDRKVELRWYSVAELAELTPPAPLIGDVIAEGSLVLMYGQWGVGKTFVALDIALSKAVGHTWHGVELTPAPVAYILAEGRGGIAARVQAWHEAHGIPDNILFRLLAQPVDFLDPAQVAALLASVEAWPDPPKLLFVDTMYRCFGGNENDTEDMNAFLTSVARFQSETGAAVVVIHHPGHEAHRGRGHSAFPQAVDAIIKVVESEGVITMSCDKQRDGLPFEKRRFRLSPRAGSMTVELAADTTDDLAPNAVSALATLNEIAAWDGASNTKWKTATKLKDRTFQRVAKTLFAGGWVEKSNEGCYLVTEKGEDALGLAT